jgi:hypothetical protein
MFNFNPDLMQLDDGEATGKRRVRAEAPKEATKEEIDQALKDAAETLDIDPAILAQEKRDAQLAAIKASRVERQTVAAEERAASDPLKDYNNRPDAQTAATIDYIIYYSWMSNCGL